MNLNIINDYDVQITKVVPYLYDKAVLEKTKNKKSILFVSSEWYRSKYTLKIAKHNPYDKTIILANTIEEKEFFENKTDCDVLFCNNNAFLDENMFTIQKDTVKVYDLMLNNKFTCTKNTAYGKLCNNVIHVGYYTEEKYNFPKFGYYANFNNQPNDYNFNKKDYIFLNGNQINTYINQSVAGGIFTNREGACRASSEYSLCGVPVISTASKGGRDIWYDSYNSIICEPNERSVYDCLQIIKNRTINPELIRESHLKIADQHKTTLVDYVIDELNLPHDTKTKDELKLKFKHLDFINAFSK